MLEIGSLLDGKYKILSEIGHGGMSVVYMALNEVANKTWAVKEIRKDGKMDFNVVRQGLVAEIETLKKLKHPNLPSIVDVIEDDDSFIIVMDYIEGNSLDKSLLEHGAQPQDMVVEWAMQLCDVLAYLHSCSPPIIYRDMKPANIMLKPDGNIALIDFGTAKTYEIDLGETTGIGTIGYAAPEQYIGSGLGRTDARTDIYCLGITLYHLLTGVDPCKVVIGDKSIRAVNPSLSQGLDEIIITCTQPDPKDRYQSCEELLYALNHHLEMGKPYRKKQKKKLAAFISSAVATLLFATVSILGFVLAEKATSQTFDAKISEAGTAAKWSDACDLLIEAISLAPEKEEPYNKMLSLFVESNSDGADKFTEAESKYISKLSGTYVAENAFGVQNTQHPLDVLKSDNREAYVKVCREIGFIYWYSYENEKDRYSKAAEWFERVKDEDSVANTLYEIVEEIPKIIKGHVNADPETFFANIKNLIDAATTGEFSGNRNMKQLILKEVVSCLSAIDLLKNIPSDSLQEVLAILDNLQTISSSDSELQLALSEPIAEARDRVTSAMRGNKGGTQQ